MEQPESALYAGPSMLMQYLNIAAGIVAALPLARQAVSADLIRKITSYAGAIGIIMLIFGALALLERIGVVWIGITGSSYPQALAALLVGFALAPHLFQKWSAIHSYIKILAHNAAWIGVAAIVIGLGSLMFGCIAPICYPL